ncbi:MAG: ABC transporter substrate-binding protein [Chloroflexi bacterium]|nr:ABC transporter substrate-binding protein [Chloroflexota bacterium]
MTERVVHRTSLGRRRWSGRAVLSLVLALGVALAGCAPAAPAPASPAAPVARATAPAAPAPTAAVGVPRPTVIVPTPAPATQPPTPTPVRTADQPRYGGTLRRVFRDPIPTLDIHQIGEQAALRPLAMVYNGLVRFDPEHVNTIQGDLAERWETSADGSVYTFYLQKGVQWHDGAPFTAEDVRYSIERILHPPKGIVSPNKSGIDMIDSVSVVDATTVRVKLQFPYAPFLTNLASGYILVLPKHILEKKGDMTQDVVGTGAFKFKKYEPGVLWEVVKNEKYFRKGRPYIDVWYNPIIRDDATRFAAVRTHQVDITNNANGLTPPQAEITRKTLPNITVFQIDMGPFFLFVMNTKRKPWNDVRVRQAVNLTIDRQAAIKAIEDGYGRVSAFFGGLAGLTEKELLTQPGFRQPKDQDIAQAKKLLAEAGYPNGFETSSVFRQPGTVYTRGAEFLAEQLSKIGIKVKLLPKDSTEYIEIYTRTLDFETISFRSAVTNPNPEGALTYILARGSRNPSQYEDPEFDRLLLVSRQAKTDEERNKIYRDIDLYLLKTVPQIPYVYGVYFGGYWNNVKNFHPPLTTTSGEFYGEVVWLAP